MAAASIFEIAGPQLATCYMVADIGTEIVDTPAFRSATHHLMLGWELVHRVRKDGGRWRIHQRYPLNLAPRAKLRRHVERWLGTDEIDQRTFDPGVLIGTCCTLTLTLHNNPSWEERPWLEVATIAPHRGPTWAAHTKPIRLKLEDPGFDPEAYHRLPWRLKERIGDSPEFTKMMTLPPADTLADDFIPF